MIQMENARESLPLIEFDSERNACINPEDMIRRIPNVPKVVVTCFLR